jgi:small-conductance mechanosensitive channel/CRP-like cAMP-binding protein
MGYIEALTTEILGGWTLYVLGSLLVTWLIMRTLAGRDHKRLSLVTYVTILHMLMGFAAAIAVVQQATFARDLHLTSVILAVVALIGMAVLVVFSVVLPRLHLRTPRILHDVVFALTTGIAIFFIASRMGYNLSGLIATSAVLTAVIGFSLQGTLNNIIGGLALQMDRSIRVGDWVQYGDSVGRITDIRWRHVDVETRDWETVVIPNSELAQHTVKVLGRRGGQPEQWRRTVQFNVDFRFPPTDVIKAVEAGLGGEGLDRVAHAPAPHVLLMDFGESFGVYGARYWLKDLRFDESTDSQIRTRIFFALSRAGIPLSRPAHSVFLTETSKRREQKSQRHRAWRLEALATIDLFKDLEEAEREYLVDNLVYTPFTHGEVLIKQGDDGDSLYVMMAGCAELRVRVDDDERVMGKLRAPNFFGEMSLLTGDARTASIVALEDCECYVLHKKPFQHIIERRPEVADQLAAVLAHRRMELDAFKAEMGGEASGADMDTRTFQLVKKIRDFFHLEA